MDPNSFGRKRNTPNQLPDVQGAYVYVGHGMLSRGSAQVFNSWRSEAMSGLEDPLLGPMTSVIRSHPEGSVRQKYPPINHSRSSAALGVEVEHGRTRARGTRETPKTVLNYEADP